MTNTSRNTVQLPKFRHLLLRIAILISIAIIIGLFSQANAEQPPPVSTPAITVSTPSADLESEQWWTTTDCPTGVAVPCLDPTVEGAPGLPVEVAAQVERLIDAQWVCIEQLGEPMPDGTVRLTGPQVQQCRQYAYIATQA